MQRMSNVVVQGVIPASMTASSERASLVRRVIAATAVLEVTAIVNAFFLDLKGATVDANRFHDAAVLFSRSPRLELAFDAQFFEQFLGWFYWLFGPYEFLYAQVNLLALAVSAVVLADIPRRVGFQRRALGVVVPFMLFPTLITRATTTLREPLMILIICVAANCLVRFAGSGRLRALVVAAVSLALGALLHKAFAVLLAFTALILVPLTRTASLRVGGQSRGSSATIKRLGVASALVVLTLGLASVGGDTRGLAPLVGTLSSDTEYIDAIVESKSGRDARAQYNAPISTAGFVATAVSIPANWAHYNFAPFPWRATRAIDLVAVAEAGFRLAGILAAVRLYRLVGIGIRRRLRPVLLLHLLVSGIFAAGTANYGTASRHQLVTNGLFLLYIWMWNARAEVLGVRRREGQAMDEARG
jgi:hypothetical protein